MTDQTERLAQIRARVQAATPGPWTTKTLHTTLADATFIAASRQDIPYLLDLAYLEPALVGCIAQIPEKWSKESRDQWLDAFMATLNFVHPASEPVDDQEERGA